MNDLDAPEIDEEVEAPEVETEEPEETSEEQAEQPEPLIVTFGDDEPEETEVAKAPEWVRELRRQNAELKRQLKDKEAATHAVDEGPGPKPTLEGCDYDPEVFEQRLNAWMTDNAKAESKREEAKRAEQQAQEAFDKRVSAYNEAKAKLPVDDFDDAEAVLLDTFNQTQQALLIKVAKQPAVFAYGLGKNPTRAKALAGITDIADFIAEAVRMEYEMKQQSGKRPPAPEKRITGGGVAGSASVDNTLARLREEAARTHDYSKLHAYKRSLRA